MVECSMMLHIDNQAAVRRDHPRGSSGRVKHIVVPQKIVKGYSKKGVVKVVYRVSRMMRANVLTKLFAAPRLRELRELMSLV
ncbi:hypothetical protein KXD40_001540 [Peronospora effusa]|nr:hypothetical protein KXD40_001540 [Peronospora effusa]